MYKDNMCANVFINRYYIFNKNLKIKYYNIVFQQINFTLITKLQKTIRY